MSSSIFASWSLVPRTSASANSRASGSTGWRDQNSSKCGSGLPSPWTSSWYRSWSASSRAFRRRPISARPFRAPEPPTARWVARTNSAISMAASAASSPRLPTAPPARSQACSSVSAVMTPKVIGTPVASAAWRDAVGGGAAHVVEVRGRALDHHAHADDRGEPAGRGERARRLRQLERARHPVHLEIASPVTPWAASAATAPSTSFLETASLKRPATTAKRPARTAAARRREASDRGERGRPSSVRERGEEVAELVALGAR